MAEETRSTKDEAIRNPPSEATTQPPAEPTAEAKPFKGKPGVCSSRHADIDGTVSAPVPQQKMILTATCSGPKQKSSLTAAHSLPLKSSSKEQTSTNSKETLKLVHKEFRSPETKQATAVASGKPLQQSTMAIAASPAGAQFQASSSSSTSEEQATFSKKESSPASSENSSANKSNTPPTSNKRIVKLEQDEPKSRKRKKKDDKNKQAGRWTGEEHQIFLRGLRTYGREWKKVAVHIPTRTSAQVRSHAQKYFAKLQREEQELEQQQQQNHQETHAAIDDDDVRGDNGTTSTSVASGSAVSDHHRIPPFRTRSAAVVPQLSALPDSVREQAERILAQPESVEAEVDETMRRLRQRYRQLQEQLQARQERDHESSSHASSIESLHNEELIALHVLQGGLEHQQQQEQQPRPPNQGD